MKTSHRLGVFLVFVAASWLMRHELAHVFKALGL